MLIWTWCYASGMTTIEETGKAMAMTLLCTLPHNGAHNYGFTMRARCLFQAMLRILLRARVGYHPAEKDRAKLIGSKLRAHLGFANEGPKEIPSGLARK